MANGPETWPYSTFGDPQKPALLLLHGFMGASLDWRDVAERLRSDFFCILPDLPGHSQNFQLPISQTLSLSSLANGLAGFLNHLSIQKIHILGYSLGGRLALRFALDFPDKVESLLLESANPGINDESQRLERLALDEQRATDLLSNGLDAFIETWYDMPLFKTLHNYPDRLTALKMKRKKNQIAWVGKYLVELSPGSQIPLWTRLPELKLPTLLLAGELDAKYVSVTKQMAVSMPTAQQIILPRAGHNTHWEKPQQFSDIVNDFLPSEDA